MSKMSFVTDMILDTFKRVLVRFKNAKFGLLFFINIFKIPDFLILLHHLPWKKSNIYTPF